jgi:hypothetical protein
VDGRDPARADGNVRQPVSPLRDAGSLLFNRTCWSESKITPGRSVSWLAGLYLVTFVLLCFMVKEGQYPPPEPPPPGGPIERFFRAARRYARECYALPFYWKYYLFNLCFMCGFVPFRELLLLFGQRVMSMHDYKTVMVQRDLLQMGSSSSSGRDRSLPPDPRGTARATR